ncbi:hypothetical protein QN277_011749 [Acacia crassicarpa]|uniref:Uncharacterized protein n=1 Tax=Acacia crassicarpa TaxID=499986 RepID=A0AAE1MZ78_9FABA|nr:hypothetical protein QN277_011749 [Acacia crassicarpa]
MDRSPTTPQAAEQEQEQVKVTSESPKKAIFYIYHPVHFLHQLLRSLFNCLGFHEISVTNNEYPKSLNRHSHGCNNPSDQDNVVVPSSPSQASDPPPTAATDQQNDASARKRPGPTPGPGPQTN